MTPLLKTDLSVSLPSLSFSFFFFFLFLTPQYINKTKNKKQMDPQLPWESAKPLNDHMAMLHLKKLINLKTLTKLSQLHTSHIILLL